METQILSTMDPRALRKATELLEADQLVAFPTDTVYGLGGKISSSKAIDCLYEVKGREHKKAIPVLIGDIDDLKQVTIRMEFIALRLAERFWPGPLTIIVPSHPSLPENLSPYATVGVRMPDHPFALNLLCETGPLAVSSANISYRPSATTALEVYDYMGGRIPLILDGGTTRGGVASTVVDCTTSEPVILRPGPLGMVDIQDALRA